MVQVPVGTEWMDQETMDSLEEGMTREKITQMVLGAEE